MTASTSATKTIRRALLSVTDKTGLVDLAKVLADFGVELVSTDNLLLRAQYDARFAGRYSDWDGVVKIGLQF